MIELTKNAITPAEIDLVLGEALRSELTRIMTDQAEADLRSDAEIEARIAALEAEIRDLKRAARRNDFEKVQPWCETAAETLDLALPAELPVEMGRQALALRRDLAELEAKVADGEEASRLAEPLVARVSTAPVETFIEAPLRVSDCRKKAGELYPTPSMQAGMDATHRLVTELVGNVPMDLLTEERQKEFFLMLSRTNTTIPNARPVDAQNGARAETIHVVSPETSSRYRCVPGLGEHLRKRRIRNLQADRWRRPRQGEDRRGRMGCHCPFRAALPLDRARSHRMISGQYTLPIRI